MMRGDTDVIRRASTVETATTGGAPKPGDVIFDMIDDSEMAITVIKAMIADACVSGSSGAWQSHRSIAAAYNNLIRVSELERDIDVGAAAHLGVARGETSRRP